VQGHASERDPGLTGVVPFRFACHRCGNCCSAGTGYVWLAEGEIERMAAQLGTSVESFVRTHVRRARDPRTGETRLALRETADSGGRCALLIGKNTCSVYTARPEHCRTFPYWPSVLAEHAAFESARSTCPGIAVAVDPELQARAFEALARLYARVDEQLGARAPDACCLEDARSEELFASALEADFAAAHIDPDARGCRLGVARPLACRLESAGADDTGFSSELRALELAHAYPRAYGKLVLLLQTRVARAEKGSG
jgi:Fe-S-cluster containining protein